MPLSTNAAPALRAILTLLLLFPPLLVAQNPPPGQVPVGSLATSTIMWNLDSACTAGALAACDTLGMHHWSTRNKKERKFAAALWDRTCAAGGTGACANLSLAYDDGEGVHRDRKKAMELARQACENGSPPACVGLASMLSDGRAGTKDPAAGAAMMDQACTMGDLYACLNMGYRTLDGSFGVARDSSRARVFMARACSVAVPNHPYYWYRDAAADACKISRDIGPPAN